jgi:hypothetical protein
MAAAWSTPLRNRTNRAKPGFPMTLVRVPKRITTSTQAKAA